MFLIWWYNCSRYLGLFLIAMLDDKGIVLDDFEAILKHWMIKWTFISKWHSDFESQTLCIFFFLEDIHILYQFYLIVGMQAKSTCRLHLMTLHAATVQS